MAGRPKRVFSDEQVKEIERLALMNCNTNTIAVALDIPFKTLKRHFAKKLRVCRALWKVNLRENQERLSKTSADMCKFLGKNYMEQVEKQEINTEVTERLQLTEAEAEDARKIARIINMDDARKGTQQAAG